MYESLPSPQRLRRAPLPAGAFLGWVNWSGRERGVNADDFGSKVSSPAGMKAPIAAVPPPLPERPTTQTNQHHIWERRGRPSNSRPSHQKVGGGEG